MQTTSGPPRLDSTAVHHHHPQDGDSSSGAPNKPQKSRHHASTACSTCRERRIRCVVPPGEAECTQCKRAGIECIIRNDDERRRPISRAYMSTLTARVSLLESMLKERGLEPPPAVYPPKTARGSLYLESEPSTSQPPPHRRGIRPSHAPVVDASLASAGDEVSSGVESKPSPESLRDRSDQDASYGTPIDDRNNGLVKRLLSTRGHLSFDQLSGKLRYYGPTTNSHIYSKLEIDATKNIREAQEQARRAERIIRTIFTETHDYLCSLFFQHYNSVLHVVHESAFMDDKEHDRTQFYSEFLHVCILAMGYRFADKTRVDMQRIALPDRENTIHREAKYMLDLELERLGGVPSVAALLILGDSEVGVGRDNVGWMYAGMAIRLAYDIGLHLDSRQSGMPELEVDIRKMTLWACVIYDKYWSLFLGRPTTMKSTDLEIYSLSNQFERLGTCKPAGPERSINTKIYETLIDLMEIAGKIVETPEYRKQEINTSQNPDQSAYFSMATIDRELRNWASNLPEDLRYTEANRSSAPFSFYLLHQQYHAALILLHRPFARYDDPNTQVGEDMSALDSHFSRASRAICTESAVAIARLFWQHRQRFNGKQIFCIGMQHAGTAATALIAGLASIPDARDRTLNMQYLEVLHAALEDMAHAYQPAERMASVLNAVMLELRGDPISPGKGLQSSSSVPTRRGSTAVTEASDSLGAKRRHTKRPHQLHAMEPPPLARQHRASDASDQRSMPPPSHSSSHSDYSMLTPRSDGASWPNVHVNEQQHRRVPHIDPLMFLTPETRSRPTTMDRQTEWMQFPSDNNDFPATMNAVPGVQEADIGSLEFLTLPSEDDWTRWHTVAHVGRGDVATDLDGFPPRNIMYPAQPFQNPSMGSEGMMPG